MQLPCYRSHRQNKKGDFSLVILSSALGFWSEFSAQVGEVETDGSRLQQGGTPLNLQRGHRAVGVHVLTVLFTFRGWGWGSNGHELVLHPVIQSQLCTRIGQLLITKLQ